MNNESSEEDKNESQTPPESTTPEDHNSGASEDNSPEDTISQDEPSAESTTEEPAPGAEVKPDTAAEPADNSTDAQAPTAPNDSAKVSQPVMPPGQSKKPSSKVLLRILAVLVVLVIAAAVYGVYKHGHKNSNSASAGVIQHLNIGIEGGDLGASVYPNAVQSGGNDLINAQIFDGLVQYENQNQIKPDLASGWSNPNQNSWLFTIKKGIKFHDGNTLTPADVAYSLNLMVKQNSDYSSTFVSTIKSVKTVGSSQVLITTTQPDPVLLNKLTYLYIVDQHLPKGDNQSMAGTGAYEFKPGTSLSHNSVQLVAFDGYWNGPVLTKSVNVYQVPTNADLVSGFKAHKYDIIGQLPRQYLNVSKNKYVEEDDGVNFIGLNTTTAPLNNKLVREAMVYAIDPTGLTTSNTAVAINQMIPPSITGYNPNLTPFTQDIAKGKQLLTQAGYPNGLTLTLNTASASLTYNEAIAKQLAEIGITLKFNNVSSIDDMINDYLDGQAQLTQLNYASNTLDGADVLDSTVIPANYNNPTFFNLVNKASETLNASTRLQLLQQAETIVHSDIPVIPLYYNVDNYMMNKPYVLHQDLSGIYLGTYFSKIHLR